MENMEAVQNWKDTILNPEWMEKHEADIKALFPSEWTESKQINGLRIGFKLKVMGVAWSSPYEFVSIMVYFDKIKLLERKLTYVRANPNSIFEKHETARGWKTVLR